MHQEANQNQYMEDRKTRLRLSTLIIFLLIPITIFIGIRFGGDRKYSIISLLILIYVMAPFFMVFEKRKPKARELVAIAMMSAITASGNLMFYMMAPFQAGTTLVIISGISFGPEAGFLIGATARFICNLFQGQGPWTPWQMFSWGILGFLSGVIFNKVDVDKKKSRDFQIILGPVICIIVFLGIAYITHVLWGEGTFYGWKLYAFGALGLLSGLLLQRKRLPIDNLTLSIFGFLATFIVYGGIMNIAAMVMSSTIAASQMSISLGSLAVLYISGTPYDGVHAFSSAFFLFIMGEKIIDKLERIKIKYGLYN